MRAIFISGGGASEGLPRDFKRFSAGQRFVWALVVYAVAMMVMPHPDMRLRRASNGGPMARPH